MQQQPLPLKGRSWKQWIHRLLPHCLSGFRLIAAPALALWILQGAWGKAFCLLVIAAVSDGLDGYLARRWHTASDLGKILDPLGDKVLIFFLFISLGWIQALPLSLICLIILRDFLILSVVCVALLWRIPLSLTPSWGSKLNTVVQLVLGALVLFSAAFSSFLTSPSPLLTQGLLTVRQGLEMMTFLTTAWSGGEYALYFFKSLCHTSLQELPSPSRDNDA